MSEARRGEARRGEEQSSERGAGKGARQGRSAGKDVFKRQIDQGGLWVAHASKDCARAGATHLRAEPTALRVRVGRPTHRRRFDRPPRVRALFKQVKLRRWLHHICTNLRRTEPESAQRSELMRRAQQRMQKTPLMQNARTHARTHARRRICEARVPDSVLRVSVRARTCLPV